MRKTGRKSIIAIAILSIALILVAFAYIGLQEKLVNLNNEIGVSFTCASIHTTYTFEKDGKVVATYYHAGAVTNLGLNFTLGKIVGAYDNTTYPYNATLTLYNCTYVSIGNKGTLDVTTTALPGEWNRTMATIHDATYNSFNMTAVFHPGTGPYTTDCIGVNYFASNATCGTFGDLWGYDTFNEVTGVDASFTITIEIKVSAS